METGEFKLRMSIAARLAGNATELSRKTGISRRAIGSYLAGCSDPTRERLIAIANVSGVSVEWLATGKGGLPCALKEPNRRLIIPGQVELSHDFEEIPIPLSVISSEEFSQISGVFPTADEVLYLRTETLSSLSYSKIDNLRAIYIDGDGVTPVGLGHTLLIDLAPEFKEATREGVYILRKESKVVVLITSLEKINHSSSLGRGDIIARAIWSCGKIS